MVVVGFRIHLDKFLDRRASIGLIIGLFVSAIFLCKTYFSWLICEVDDSFKGLPARELTLDVALKEIRFVKVNNDVWKREYIGEIISAPIVRVDMVDKLLKLTLINLQKTQLIRKGDVIRVKGVIKEGCSLLCCTYTEGDEMVSHYIMSDGKMIEIIKNDMFTFWHDIRSKIKQSIRANQVLTSDAKGFVVALTLGDKSLMPLYLKHLFANTGTMHLFAVSGLHVGICCVFFKSIFIWIFPHNRFHVPLCLMATFIYVLLVGASVSSCRAFIMICFFYSAKIFYKRKNGVSSLAWSALILLFWDPNYINSLGFQLSFTVVLGILYAMEPQVRPILYSKIGIALSSAKVSLSAFLSSSLLIIDCFHHINLLSIPLNIILVFIITPIFIFLFLILDAFMPIHYIGECINTIVHFMKVLISYFNSIDIAHIEFPATFDIPNFFHLLFPILILASRPFLSNLPTRLIFLTCCPLSFLVFSLGN